MSLAWYTKKKVNFEKKLMRNTRHCVFIYYEFKCDMCMMCVHRNVIIIGDVAPQIRHLIMSISPFFIFRFMRKCERCPRGIIVIPAIRIACGTSCALVKRRFPVSRPIRVNLVSRAFTCSMSTQSTEREAKKLHLIDYRIR